MAKKPHLPTLAHNIEAFVNRYELDTSEPTHLNSVAKNFDIKPSLVLRLLRVQRDLEPSVTERWRRAKVYIVSLQAMEGLCNERLSKKEQLEAFRRLQYKAEVPD